MNISSLSNKTNNNFAELWGVYRARNCAQVKSTCVGDPSLNHFIWQIHWTEVFMRKLIFVLNVAQVRWESAHCIILSIALRPSKFRSERVYTATLGSTERVYTATLGSTERVYMATLGESVHALIWLVLWWVTGCPNKHGNSVTNSLSSLLWISLMNLIS